MVENYLLASHGNRILYFLQKYFSKSYKKHLYNDTKEVLHKSFYSKYKIELDKESFSKVRDESIDYAIMEKQKNCKVILYHGIWSDIGSFQSLYDFLPKEKDEHVNHHNQSKIISINSSTSFIHKKIVSLVGVKDDVLLKQTIFYILVI